MSQDPKLPMPDKSNSRSMQAADSLNNLLDQCETQRSQLDQFLAGFEKKVAGKTVIGQAVAHESPKEEKTQVCVSV